MKCWSGALVRVVIGVLPSDVVPVKCLPDALARGGIDGVIDVVLLLCSWSSGIGAQ